MAYALGMKALRKLCADQDPMTWQKAKLSPAFFKPYELKMFEWVQEHLNTHHALPQLQTLEAVFPEVSQLDTPEPASYYIKLLENQFFYERINKANLDSQQVLKDNPDDHEKALGILQATVRDILEQKYRQRVVNVNEELQAEVTAAYWNLKDQGPCEKADFVNSR